MSPFYEYLQAVTNLSNKSWAVLCDTGVSKLSADLHEKVCALDEAIDLVNAKQDEFKEWHEQKSEGFSDVFRALLWLAQQSDLDPAVRNAVIEGVKAKIVKM